MHSFISPLSIRNLRGNITFRRASNTMLQCKSNFCFIISIPCFRTSPTSSLEKWKLRLDRLPPPYRLATLVYLMIIRVAYEPTLTALPNLLSSVKDRDDPINRQGAVYISTLTRDLLNTNKPREMVLPTITSLYIIN